uniref:Transmembrane protein n=1 Tax=Nelumbo nucifera TaxID=4432 RepID=A0A822Y545_NELNU|nr:TPA_asm: hypothetical protein HUJ06_029045 [Nelumbo nucifera]
MRERSAKTRENKVLNRLSCYRNLFTAAHRWFTSVHHRSLPLITAVHLCSLLLITSGSLFVHRRSSPLVHLCCSGGSEHGVPLPRGRRERKRGVSQGVAAAVAVAQRRKRERERGFTGVSATATATATATAAALIRFTRSLLLQESTRKRMKGVTVHSSRLSERIRVK